MSSFKDKAIKWLGGFTKAEVEEVKAEDLHREPYIVHDRLNTVKLYSSWWIWDDERINERHLLRVLAEGLTKEIEKYIEIEVSTDESKRFYTGKIEIVVREGAE